MNITIRPHAEPRLLEAIERREQLMRMRTREMHNGFEEELRRLDATIATAVSTSIKLQRYRPDASQL